MHKMHFLSCIALTLAFLADGAPTSGSRQEARLQLEQLTLDLQRLLDEVSSYLKAEPSSSMMISFKFYMPKKVTELKHLQCLMEEFQPLKEVLNLTEGSNFHVRRREELLSNINVMGTQLKGHGTQAPCEFNEETVTIVEFLTQWVTFCQSISQH